MQSEKHGVVRIVADNIKREAEPESGLIFSWNRVEQSSGQVFGPIYSMSRSLPTLEELVSKCDVIILRVVMSGKRLTPSRILKATFCVVALCLVSLFVLVKYWAGPEYARIRFERAVSRFWDGRLRFEDVRISLLGQAYFEGVSFLDNESREWAYATTISATLGNWPSRAVYLRAVEVDNLAVKLHTYVRKETFPLKAPPGRSGKKKKKPHGVLRAVIVNDGSLETIDLDRGRIHFGRLTVLANRMGDRFEISSSVAGSDKSKDIVVKGTLDTTSSEVDFSLTVDRDMTGEELAPWISLLNQPIAFEIAGRLTVDVGLKGKLNDPTNLLVQGDIRCKNGRVYVDNKTVVADVNAFVRIDGHQLDLKEFSGSFCGGTIQCTVHVDDYRSESMGITGELQAEDVNLAELAEKSDYQGRITKGKVTLRYSFSAKNTNPNTLSGKGTLAVDGADIFPMPLLSKISRTIGLTDEEMQASSDAISVFTTDGFVIEIGQAYLTNQHAAIVVEPGGTINVQRQTLDMYVNAIQLRFVGDFIRKLPVVKLFVGLSDKLTRLHVKGHWSDPASELLRKEPVKDLTEGVTDFFLDAARSGGQLKDSVIDTSLGIFNGTEKRD